MYYFLGMEVSQGIDEIIYRSKYTYDMFKKYGMDECKPILTPIAHDKLLCKDDETTKLEDTTYGSLARSLMFLRNTRLDISQVVSLVLRYMGDPTEEHLKETNRNKR